MFSPQALHLGPLMLPWGLVIALSSLLLALWITGLFKHKFGYQDAQWKSFKDSIWSAVWIGLIVGRLVFVALNYQIYLAHPIEIIKIQDKGFHFFSAAFAAVAWLLWKNRHAHLGAVGLFMAIVIMISSTGYWAQNQVQREYQNFPEVALNDQQGRHVTLPNFIGKPTVINLWASWCPPCHREMPVLQQAQRDHPNVQFVMINQGEQLPTIQAYFNQHQLQFKHVLLDPEGKTPQATGMYGLPSTLFFDAHGQLISTHMGEISHAVLAQKIEKIKPH